jgi:hypothetical protein
VNFVWGGSFILENSSRLRYYDALTDKHLTIQLLRSVVPPSSGPSGEIFRDIKLLETTGNYLEVDMEQQTGGLKSLSTLL